MGFFVLYTHTHAHTHIYIRFYFNNHHNYQTSLSLEGDLSNLQLRHSYLVFKASFPSFHSSSAARVSFIFQNLHFTCKHRMCLCFILHCIWKSTCRMNFQAAYLGPDKSCQHLFTFWAFWGLSLLLVKQKNTLHHGRTQLLLCSGIQSIRGWRGVLSSLSVPAWQHLHP